MSLQNETNLKQQIKETFYKAMNDKLEDITFENISQTDIEWLATLIDELRERINKLTPNRIDLQVNLNKSIDINLLKQMLKHAAFEYNDLEMLVKTIFNRLYMLCAPIQDKKIKKMESQILESEFGKGLSLLIMECNLIIDEIEQYVVEFKQNSMS